ncbi:hypothetical protein J6590_084960 [Homalodisca vitripennis]|nr:hypothetical protein J6590_084960 [Homalodisca vitripennis]
MKERVTSRHISGPKYSHWDRGSTHVWMVSICIFHSKQTSETYYFGNRSNTGIGTQDREEFRDKRMQQKIEQKITRLRTKGLKDDTTESRGTNSMINSLPERPIDAP